MKQTSAIRAHIMIDVPELASCQYHECATDWRIGKRIQIGRDAIWMVWGCMLVFGIPIALLTGWGVVQAVVSGVWEAFAFWLIVGLIFGGLMFGLFFYPIYKAGGKRVIVIDWDNGTLSHQHRRKLEVFPLSKIDSLEVSIHTEPGERGEQFTRLNIRVGDRLLPMVETYAAKTTSQECAARLARLASRLAESLGVPYQINCQQPKFNGAADDPTGRILELAPDLATVASKYVELADRVIGFMILAEYRGELAEAERHREEAKFHLMQAATLDPANPTPLMKLGELAQDSGISRQAVDVARSVAPDDPNVMLRHAEQLLGDGDLDDAVRVLTEIIEQSPSCRAFEVRAEVYVERIQFDLAIADLTAAIELPETDKRLTVYFERRAEAWVDWYRLTRDQAFLQHAIDDYERADQQDPGHALNRVAKARTLALANLVDEALEILAQVIADYPDDDYPLSVRATILLEKQRDPVTACGDLTSAIRILEGQPLPGQGVVRRLRNAALAHAFRCRAQAFRDMGRISEANADEVRAEQIENEETGS